MQCQYCGKYFADDTEYCPSCGQTQRAVPTPSPYDPQNVNRPQAPGAVPAAGYGQAGQPWQGGVYAPPPNTYSRAPGAYGGAEVMTTGQFILAILLSGIPIVGFILLLVWALSKKTNPNKRNWARAQLVFLVLLLIVMAVFYGSLLASLF